MTIIKKIIPVSGMTCASCVRGIENELSKTNGINKVAANLAENTVLVEFNADEIEIDAVYQKIKSIGYNPILNSPENKGIDLRKRELQHLKSRLIVSSLLAVPVFIQGMFLHHIHSLEWISFILTLLLLVFPGRHFFVTAWKQARKGRSTMDTLVAMSTGVAFLFSSFSLLFPAFFIIKGLSPAVYFESAAIIIAFIILGKYFEEKAKTRSADAIHLLMNFQPSRLSVIRNNEEITIGADEVKPFDRVIIKPSGRIPVDGKVIKGQSWVDESMFTGEALPVKKEKGSDVKAGTLNQNGSLIVLAEHTGEETHLAHIVRIIREAQSSKAPVQRMADSISSWFVPAVIAIAFITFGLWMYFGGMNHLNHAILSMVSVLIIACPCALGLATPAAIMAGINRAALEGILIKDASALERAAHIRHLYIDKTGTLTSGHTKVTEETWNTSEKEEMLHVFTAMERMSEHPLSQAIITKYSTYGLNTEVQQFEAVRGMGIKGIYQDEWYLAGNFRLMETHNIESLGYEKKTDNGLSEVFFANSKIVLAHLSIHDPVKPESRKMVEDLRKIGIETSILSGDKESSVKRVALECSIKSWKSNLLPEDKHRIIKDSHLKNQLAAMAGDGINDAAALAEADVSIAMGHGSDIALDTAGITLMNANLSQIPMAIRLSKKTLKIIHQNLFWAFFYNIICIPLAAGAFYPAGGWLLSPMIAGAAMAFSSVSVVSNSLRLKYIKI